MEIINHEAEKLVDPTGILVGDRYEVLIDIEVDEDDELFSENGLYIKLILAVVEDKVNIPQYQIFERVTDQYLDFALEDEELDKILVYCKENIL